MTPDNLANKIPDFKSNQTNPGAANPVDMTAVATIRRAKGLREITSVILLAIVVVSLLELILTWTHTPKYVFPKPTEIIHSLFTEIGRAHV